MSNKRINNLDKKKVTRFSIRTYKGYGAASIIVSAFFLFLNHNHMAYADEINKDITTTMNVNDTDNKNLPQIAGSNSSENQLNTKETLNSDKREDVTTSSTAQVENDQPVNSENREGQVAQITQLKDTPENDKQTYSSVNNETSEKNLKSNENDPETSTKHSEKSTETKMSKQPETLNRTKDLGHSPEASVNNQSENSSTNTTHRIRKRDVDPNSTVAVNSDPLHTNETNTSIQNGHFTQVTGGTLPTRSQKLTVVTGVEHWHSLSTDPNPEFPILNTLSAKDYPSFQSDASAPYGVVLAKTTNGRTRSALDPKVAGIYQDIDVVPGSELVVNFISTSMTFSDGVTGAQLKISDTSGNHILFNSRLNGMGSFPTGKLNAMVNIPDNLNRVRLTFSPNSNRPQLTTTHANSGDGYGTASADIDYGGAVSKVDVNSGAYIESSLPQARYDLTAASATVNVARGTISFDLENKGHTQSKSTVYKVTLPANSKFISASGAQGSYNQHTNVLTLNIGNMNPGQRKTISYTAEFQATVPKQIDLNGNLTYQTNASFRGSDRQKTGTHAANTQTVQLLMYKTDLQTKVNEMNQRLAALNEAEYTPESWSALKNKITEGNQILNEEHNNTELAQRQNQATINQVTADLETLYVQLKEVSPAAPTVSADNQRVTVTITPAAAADKIQVKYVDTNGQNANINAIKTGQTWALDNTVQGIEIDSQNGNVTVNYTAVQPGSLVKATDTKGNSEPSDEQQINMPIKETTPSAPNVAADEPSASVVVTPLDNATHMTIQYVNPQGTAETISATKNGQTWELSNVVNGISINDQTGEVTVQHNVVQPSSEVKATAVKGNSDESAESQGTMPVKQATPAAPTVMANEASASVTVAPQGDITSMTVKYTNPAGTEEMITANKNGQGWSLDNAPAGISINNQTGEVTVQHTAVQPSSEVKATAVKGNSDESGESKVAMPVKQATPAAPTVSADEPNASVKVTPQGDITSMTIKYTDTTGTQQTITAAKNGQNWSLDNTPNGFSINDQTGEVTVQHTAVQPSSEVKATAIKGNSDASSESKVAMPIKEATPQSPIVSADEPNANVTVTPQGDITSMTIKYTNPAGTEEMITANKNGQLWMLSSTVDGVSINDHTGEVTVQHTAVQQSSEVKATAVKGNSDESAESQGTMPVKQATPLPPSVVANESHANVTVTPQGDVTSIIIKYTDVVGTEQEVTATKANNMWSLNPSIAGILVNEQTGEVTVQHNAVQPSSEVKATAVKGNSDVSNENQAAMPVKQSTPASPIVTADSQQATVTITPDGQADKVQVKYVNIDGQDATINAIKSGQTWMLDNNISGIDIDPQNGNITVNYTVVQPGSLVKASDTKGNSDPSNEQQVNMPIKEVTPSAPEVVGNEPTASVVVTPQGDTTKISIQYVNPQGMLETISATKNGQSWGLSNIVDGISINEQTGVVTVQHNAVQPSSEVKATAIKGNSDASSESKVAMPVKQATPAAPNIETDEPSASVTVTPQGDITSMMIKYTNPAGTEEIVTATKTDQDWTLDSTPAGISINNQTGVVTVQHIAVQPSSEVKATAIKENSDASSESKIAMPVKQPTPAAPNIETDEPSASVTVTPQGDITSMMIKYTNPAGTEEIVTATKNDQDWTLDNTPNGFSINEQTGEVTVQHNVVQPSSEVKATAIKGNSDASSESKVAMPVKQTTPTSPTVAANNQQATVTITPDGQADKVQIKYVSADGQDSMIHSIKTGQTWRLDSNVQGIDIDSQTGNVTINYNAVQPGSLVKASDTKGNSDNSDEQQINMPIKEVTPPAPNIESNEPTASVKVTPQGDITSMTIKYINPEGAEQNITATKNGQDWSLNNTPAGISINNQTGEVTVQHTAVQPSSEIKATAVKGNSDASSENKVVMPIKEATPSSPTITANESNASISVAPLGDITLMTIKYINPEGAEQNITATKNGQDWSLNNTPAGISINNQTGEVIVQHTAVQPESEIQATATKGNSDPSQTASITTIAKMPTPQSPATIEEDTEQHITTVRPPEGVNHLTIEIENTDASEFTIKAEKQNGIWELLNNQYPTVSINSNTGEVTIPGEIAQFEGTITATVKNGNSDGNSVTQTLAAEEFEDDQLPILYVTVWVDTDGKILKDAIENDKHPEEAKQIGSFDGYRYVGMEMKDGITRYIFKKLTSSSQNNSNQINPTDNQLIDESHTHNNDTNALPSTTENEKQQSSETDNQEQPDSSPMKQNNAQTQPNTQSNEDTDIQMHPINQNNNPQDDNNRAEMTNSATTDKELTHDNESTQLADNTIVDDTSKHENEPEKSIDNTMSDDVSPQDNKVNDMSNNSSSQDNKVDDMSNNSSLQDNKVDDMSNNMSSQDAEPPHSTDDPTDKDSMKQGSSEDTLVATSQPEDGILLIQQPLPVLHVTVWVNTKGEILKDAIEDAKYSEAERAAGTISGYRFVKTTTEDGITRHIFEKLPNIAKKDNNNLIIDNDSINNRNVNDESVSQISPLHQASTNKGDKQTVMIKGDLKERVKAYQDQFSQNKANHQVQNANEALPETGKASEENRGLLYTLMSVLGLSLIVRRKNKQRQ